jgi:hypothetical protein
MGSPLSSTMAEIFLQDLEQNRIKHLLEDEQTTDTQVPKRSLQMVLFAPSFSFLRMIHNEVAKKVTLQINKLKKNF